MTGFDRVIMVDWSGGNDTGARPRKDAIWVAGARAGQASDPLYIRNRIEFEAWIRKEIDASLAANERLLVGFDFPFGYPQGFARCVTGSDDPFALWAWLAKSVEDAPKANNRFDVAAELNRLFPGVGPFWGNGLARDIDDLPRKGLARMNHGMRERRQAEEVARGAFPLWQLSGAGAVGSQALMGLPVLHRLRQSYAETLRIWPFETLDAPVAFVEIWPSLVVGDAPEGWIKDAWQVAEVARMVSALPPAELSVLLDVDAPEEGWILGLGQEEKLRGDPVAPTLNNDCFALPQGVSWIPVNQALATLKDRLSVTKGIETVSLFAATGRILAQDMRAKSDHPPHPNTAVDGYGFAGGRPAGAQVMPLVAWDAPAGIARPERVPEGSAIRILTGAALPDGVDTVVLQEDVAVKGGKIAFTGPVRQGSNTRAQGEDMTAGDIVLKAGRRLTPADVGVLSTVGHGSVAVREPLRVGVLSTGDELCSPGAERTNGQIYDANRPMLLGLVSQLGHAAVDLGHVPDNRTVLRANLDKAAARVDLILTTGGASSGDADHVSALLQEAGAMTLWRIAIKPGRPLALGIWAGCPLFGLPGNPVAAMVCTLVFARPSMALMAGMDWPLPESHALPAAFSKRKRAGRREFLRARVRDGQVQIFASEGSGRISGLSWAEGLVELSDNAQEIKPGDLVRYIPWAGFGL